MSYWYRLQETLSAEKNPYRASIISLQPSQPQHTVHNTGKLHFHQNVNNSDNEKHFK